MTEAQISAERAAQEKIAFAEIDRLRMRLDDVAHNVLRANADLCEKTTLDTGLRTQTLKSFSKELRAGAMRELGLNDVPKVVYIRAGSGADMAGITVGDVLQTMDGKPLAASSRKLADLVGEGGALQRVRGADVAEVKLTGVKVCDYPAGLKMSSAINAVANGKSIMVTAGMMDFVKSDDELAYIVGHELAHNTQSHIRKSITNYILSLGGTRYTRPFEAEADYVGMYYMERAGYNSDGVEDLWRRLARLSMRPIGRAKTHPAYPERAVQILATRDEIAKKRGNGDPLKPEPKDGPND